MCSVFDTELIGIEGVKVPEKASSVAGKASEGVKAAAASIVSEAAEVVKTALADTDGDGQEHNEL